MRQIIYSVAASLDGYIARSDHSFDWIPMDPEVDFAAMFKPFDVMLMGRKTFEITQREQPEGGQPLYAGMARYVFSKSSPAGKRHGVEFVNKPPSQWMNELREKPGRDIWLMGGGDLAGEFLREDLIDGISVAICPVVLGSGIPMFPAGFPQRQFRFVKQRVYQQSGIVMVDYDRDR